MKVDLSCFYYIFNFLCSLKLTCSPHRLVWTVGRSVAWSLGLLVGVVIIIFYVATVISFLLRCYLSWSRRWLQTANGTGARGLGMRESELWQQQHLNWSQSRIIASYQHFTLTFYAFLMTSLAQNQLESVSVSDSDFSFGFGFDFDFDPQAFR